MPGLSLVVAFVASLVVVGFIVLVFTPVAPLIVVLLAIPVALAAVMLGGLWRGRSAPAEGRRTGPGTSKTATGASRPDEGSSSSAEGGSSRPSDQ